MEDGLGIVLLHIVTLQWDVLYPAALGEQQVCPFGHRVHVRASGGSDGWRPTAMLNT